MKLSDFSRAKNEIFSYFGVTEDYFIKVCENCFWEVVNEEDFQLLRFNEPGSVKESKVIVKKNNEPMIYRKQGYTLIVALDCVKICFIFDNTKEIS